jgi:predicted dehydrogenase
MTQAPFRIRVGVIGGGFSARSHVDALRRVPGIEIAGIAASTPERSRAVADELGLPPAADYRAMLEDGSIEVVHDCTPNALHLEVNSAALRAGKHLLSEKPLGMDPGETGRLVALARDAGVLTGVCFTYRHYPLIQELRAALASGAHGPVHLVSGGYLQDWLLLPTDWNWRLDADRGGASRAIADIGSHWIDLVQHVTGDRISEVCADLGTLHPIRFRPSADVQTFLTGRGEREAVTVSTEDWASVLFRTQNGAKGSFTVSQVSAGRKNHLFLEVDAAESSFSWDQEEPNTLLIGKRSEPSRLLPRDPSLLSPVAAGLAHYPGGHQEGWPDALLNLFLDFYGGVRAAVAGAGAGGTAPGGSFATFEDAHRTTQTVDAILTSHAEQRWVRVGTLQEVDG